MTVFFFKKNITYVTKKVTQIYTKQKRNPLYIESKLKVPQIYIVYTKQKNNIKLLSF